MGSAPGGHGEAAAQAAAVHPHRCPGRRRATVSASVPAGNGSERERDELEAVDVDEPAIGDLQRRDHREREEGERLDRLGEGHAERADGSGERPARARAPRPSGRSESSPATGSGSSASTPSALGDGDPAAELVQPPRDPRASPRRRRRRRSCCGRRGRRSSRTLRARRPKPRTKPRPTRPVSRWRSSTTIFARSRSGSATAWPSRPAGSSTSEAVHDLAGDEPDHPRLSRPARESRTSRRRSRRREPSAWPIRAPRSARSRPTGRPRLRTSWGTNDSSSSRSRMSAW